MEMWILFIKFCFECLVKLIYVYFKLISMILPFFEVFECFDVGFLGKNVYFYCNCFPIAKKFKYCLTMLVISDSTHLSVFLCQS